MRYRAYFITILIKGLAYISFESYCERVSICIRDEYYACRQFCFHFQAHMTLIYRMNANHTVTGAGKFQGGTKVSDVKHGVIVMVFAIHSSKYLISVAQKRISHASWDWQEPNFHFPMNCSFNIKVTHEAFQSSCDVHSLPGSVPSPTICNVFWILILAFVSSAFKWLQNNRQRSHFLHRVGGNVRDLRSCFGTSSRAEWAAVHSGSFNHNTTAAGRFYTQHIAPLLTFTA